MALNDPPKFKFVLFLQIFKFINEMEDKCLEEKGNFENSFFDIPCDSEESDDNEFSDSMFLLKASLKTIKLF